MIVNKNFILMVVAIAMISVAKAQDINDARQLIESERYSSAEILLEKSIGANEPGPEVNYLLVKSYLEQDKTEEAGKYVTRHLQSALSSDVDPLNRIACARYLLNTGNKKAAEEIFSSVFSNKKNQKKPSILLAMAEVVIDEKEGDAKAALIWLHAAEKRDKHNPEINILIGLAYRKLGDATNAYLSYQNAIRKDPNNVRANYFMGKIFTAQKNPDIYMQHFMRAYAIDSTYAPVLEELYNHYYYRDVRKAKTFLEKYIANTDYSLQNDYYLTDILYLTGDYQQAIHSASKLIDKQQAKVQPRLYKLMAYSYAKSGDTTKALQYINDYFRKEEPVKVIAPDYQFIAQLMEKVAGQEEGAIRYYSIAFDMDTVAAEKAAYADAIADLYKKIEDYGQQAVWLGKNYEWKKKTNNVDLFNWGLAYYKTKNYPMTDTVFAKYTERYPEDIYGYYWRAQANAAIDTSMTDSLAISYYRKVVELGERDIEKNKMMLLKAYGYLGGYEANITKNYAASLAWFEKYRAIEENTDITRYIEMLQKWIEEKH